MNPIRRTSVALLTIASLFVIVGARSAVADPNDPSSIGPCPNPFEGLETNLDASFRETEEFFSTVFDQKLTVTQGSGLTTETSFEEDPDAENIRRVLELILASEFDLPPGIAEDEFGSFSRGFFIYGIGANLAAGASFSLINFSLGDLQFIGGHSLGGAVGKKNPALYFSFELANTTDEDGVFLFELDQELLPFTEQRGDAQIEVNLSVIDNNGDGASANADGVTSVSRPDPNGAFDINRIISFPGTQGFASYDVSADEKAPGSFTALIENLVLSDPQDPTVGQGMTIEVNVSAGDTAVIDGFFAVSNGELSLPSVGESAGILAELRASNAAVNEFLATLPEPTTLTLMTLTLMLAWQARKRDQLR